MVKIDSINTLVFLICVAIGIVYGNYILYKIEPATKKEWLLYAILIIIGATVIGGALIVANLLWLLK